MKKLVIFDLDGTLVNTLVDLADSVNYALETFGFPRHNIETYRYFVGNGVYKLIEQALPKENANTKTIEHVKSLFLSHYTIHKTDKSYVYPQIHDLLIELQQKGILLAVASNKYHEATQDIIAYYFPDIHFVKVLGQRDGIPTKPNPSIVKEILVKTQMTPSETLYVGDSGVDMQTAHNAGIFAIGVTWGLRTKEELQNNNADLIIDAPMQIITHFF